MDTMRRLRSVVGLSVAIAVSLLALPAGCGDDTGGQNQNNNTGDPVCGDGVLDPGEQCDNGSENSDTNPDACRTSCRDPYCGDGVVDTGEQCDGSALAGETCASLGLGNHGTLTCADCTFSDASCYTCGDGLLDPGEACDGTAFPDDTTCTTETGHPDGALSCTPDCQVDPSDCHTCGNDALEVHEQCDGSDLGTSTCASLGYDGGTLACNADCTYHAYVPCDGSIGCVQGDQSACFTCGDGYCFINSGETHASCPQDCNTALVHFLTAAPSGTVGTAVTLQAEVLDASGFVVPGVQVTFDFEAGDGNALLEGAHSPVTVTTDALGRAQVTYTIGTTWPQAYRVRTRPRTPLPSFRAPTARPPSTAPPCPRPCRWKCGTAMATRVARTPSPLPPLAAARPCPWRASL